MAKPTDVFGVHQFKWTKCKTTAPPEMRNPTWRPPKREYSYSFFDNNSTITYRTK